MLPQDFLTRMEGMLGKEYPAFLASYEEGRSQALRINTLRMPGGAPSAATMPKTAAEVSEIAAADQALMADQAFEAFHLTPVPWCENGFYYEEGDEPGRHPLHEAGAYYIQEPSAMAPAGLLQARPGERMLDLCAAPGGKSTQLAEAMQGRGILVCNEIHPARAKILSENIERMGVRNAIVTNETPERLSERFPCWFDRILVDAPCSGEGMFRKNEQACLEWSPQNVRLCAERQDEILDSAAEMLRPGGRLVYSTCTFSPEENEGSVSRFLERHADFFLLEADKTAGMSGGVAAWTDQPAPHLERTLRLWPHRLNGEGHFAAVMQKEGGLSALGSESLSDPRTTYSTGQTGSVSAAKHSVGRGKNVSAGKGKAAPACKGKPTPAQWESFMTFWRENISEALPPPDAASTLLFGEQLYLMPEGAPSLEGLKVLRPGLHLGTLKKDRFEPAHALSHVLRPEEVRRVWPLSAADGSACAYLSGETIPVAGEKGWYLMTIDGFGLGWGKLTGGGGAGDSAPGILKNHYPKGLRIRKGKSINYGGK